MSKSQKKTIVPDEKKSTTKPAKSKKATKPVKSAGAKQEMGKKAANAKKTSRNSSKQNILITLLERSGGATVEEMVKATGWQNHSVLGAVSGVLRKRLGLSIASTKEERGRVYRIGGAR